MKNQLQWTLILNSLDCAPSAHPKTFFHLPLRCSLHLSSWQFLLSGQNLKCLCSFVLKSDWYRQTKAPEVDNFSRRCYQTLSSPCFLRREPGNEATSLLCTLYAAVHYIALCNTTHNTQLSRASTALQVIWPRLMSSHVSTLWNTPMERSVMEHTFVLHVSTSLVLNIAFSINLWTFECGQHLQKI